MFMTHGCVMAAGLSLTNQKSELIFNITSQYNMKEDRVVTIYQHDDVVEDLLVFLNLMEGNYITSSFFT